MTDTISYDRGGLRPRWLHIGFGAFARAHILMVLHRSLAAAPAAERDWGVTVARLNSGRAELDALEEEGCLYHVAETDDCGVKMHAVGPVIGTLHPARDGIGAIPDHIARPELELITLTITEKGYCLADGGLRRDDPAIQADLANPTEPRSAVGVLVEGLARRKAAGHGALTILSCDNLMENGHLTRAAVTDFARLRDPELAAWIEATIGFPSSMVDRIVPAMTEADHDRLAAHLGRRDANGIVCEPFLQWAIEDDFAAARPPLDLGGAQWVKDIQPWEALKLRMLNGSHSFLALLGGIAGHRTIDACMTDPVFAQAVERLMLDEAAPTLPPLPEADIPAYSRQLLARFSNSQLKHRTAQIATDTSQKLPQRFVTSVNWHIDRASPWPLSALTVAGWMRWIDGVDEQGNELPVNDPLAERLASIAATTQGPGRVEAVLGLRAVFPEALATRPEFIAGVSAAYEAIGAFGAREAVARVLNGETTR
ncbi:MAG: mannitol dehydrogenase family protein [Mesorhizobium sp.]|nr:mannitol dehydrogenase family protein [Mesorhizobium sp.]